MKRLNVCLLVGFLVVFLGGSCWGAAAPIYDSSKLILMVDSKADSDGSVTFQLTNYFLESGWNAGYVTGSGTDKSGYSFTSFGSPSGGPFPSVGVTIDGNTLVDFAVGKETGGTWEWKSLAWGDGVGTLSGAIIGESELPGGLTDWYRTLTLSEWANVGSFSLQVATDLSKNDGFSYAPPGAPVPIPTTAFLLGTGVLGIVGIRKKFMK